MFNPSKPTSKCRDHGGAAELKLSYTEIVAPAAGIVLKRSAEVGEHINAASS